MKKDLLEGFKKGEIVIYNNTNNDFLIGKIIKLTIEKGKTKHWQKTDNYFWVSDGFLKSTFEKPMGYERVELSEFKNSDLIPKTYSNKEVSEIVHKIVYHLCGYGYNNQVEEWLKKNI